MRKKALSRGVHDLDVWLVTSLRGTQRRIKLMMVKGCFASFAMAAVLVASPCYAIEEGVMASVLATIKPVTYDTLSLDGLRKEMVFVAGQIQEHEAAASVIEGQIQALQKQVEEIQAAIIMQQGQLNAGMESVVRLSQTSPLVAFFMEKDANDFVRSGLLLQSLLPALKHRSNWLALQLDQLRQTQGQVDQKRHELDPIISELVKKKGILSRLYAAKANQAGIEPKVAFDEKVLMAASMEQLLAYVKLKKAPGKAMQKVLGKLTLKPPVQGKLLTLYDVDKHHIPYSQGVVIETRAGAQVISPVAGQVIFAGPFRDFGNLLILKTQGNYHVVLLGLSKIDVAIGQELLSGEPIGEMGPSEGKVTLGLELRENTHIIDPTPWVMEWNR